MSRYRDLQLPVTENYMDWGYKKSKVAGLWSDIKYFIRLLTFYPLGTGPVHSCAISTLMSQVKHFRVSALPKGHNIETMCIRDIVPMLA